MKWTAKNIALFALCICLLSISAIATLYLKKESADGRVLIWKIGKNILHENRLFGIGFGQFKSRYMNYQAEYFKNNFYANEIRLADDTNYAFNEYLQATVENGFIGLLLMLSILLTVLFARTKKRNDFRHVMLKLNFMSNETSLPTLARAGILCIAIFSLFSYPSQILPIKTNLVLFLATIAKSRQLEKAVSTNIPKRVLEKKSFSLGISAFIALLVLASFATFKIHFYQTRFQLWKEAQHLYSYEVYANSIVKYAEAYPGLKHNGDFLTNYGKALFMAGRHEEALEILKEAENLFPNTVSCIAKGDSYKHLGKYPEAEQAYFDAFYMKPNRLYPKYLLVKLYQHWNKPEAAKSLAEDIMNMDIKVPSKATLEIRSQMEKYLRDNQTLKLR